MQRLDVRLLGGFQVEVDSQGVPADAWKHGRATQLVKLLSLAPGHRLDREQVVEALWPHLEPEAGVANLHKAASYARKALGDRDAVVLRGGRVELAPDAEVATDVERLEAGATEVDGGELLPDDRYEEWTLEPRERLRTRRLAALRARGDWDRILAEDPANEEAHRALMRSEIEAGDRAAAVRRYQRLRDELAGLGLTPEPATTELWAEISRGPAVQGHWNEQPLVDRRAEARLLERALERAESGHGGLVVVAGDPGIGKTRVAETALKAAGGRGWHVLRGNGRAGEGGTPYAPVIQALQSLIRERPDLGGHLPRSGETLLAALGPHAGRGDDAEKTVRHQEIAITIADLLAVAARERGVLLCLEDMHAGDAATGRLVEHLAGAAVDQRQLIVVCVRPDESGSAIARMLSRLGERGVAIEVHVGPLDRSAVEELARAAADTALSADAVDAIARTAGGNPFYVEELARSVDDTGEVSVPASLHAVLDGHLERLDASAAALLPVLAALDEPVDAAAVASLARVSASDAAAALEEAGRAGVVAADRDGRYSFRHPLVHDAARERVAAADLAAAHAALATRLADQEAPPERVAHHLLRAGRPRDAAPLLHEAAQWALEVGAFGEGLTWIEEAARHADPSERDEMLPLLAELRHRTGHPEAPAAYDRAVAAAPDEPRRLALRVQQVRAYLATGEIEAATEVLDSLDLADASDADRARATMARGIVAWHRREIDAARALASESAKLYETAGLASELGEQEDLAAMVAHADGQWTRHVRWRLGEAWELPQVASRVYDAYLCVTEYVMQSGEPYDELREFARQLRSHARRAGARRGEAFATTILGEAELLAGDPGSAREHLTEAARISREIRSTGSEAVARARLAEAMLRLGDREGAAAHIDDALALAYRSSLASHLLPLAHRIAIDVAADSAEAMERLERAESILDESAMCPFCRVGYYVAAAGACAGAGDAARGRGFLERAQRGTELWVGGTPWSAAIAHARAELLVAEGHREEAVVELRRAAEGFAGAGQRLNERLAREALASVS